MRDGAEVSGESGDRGDGVDGADGADGWDGADTADVGQLTLHQAAEQLGVHYMTAYRYVRLGLLPAAKDGATWRVRAADLAAFRERSSGSRTRRSPAGGSGDRRGSGAGEGLVESRSGSGEGRAGGSLEGASGSGAGASVEGGRGPEAGGARPGGRGPEAGGARASGRGPVVDGARAGGRGPEVDRGAEAGGVPAGDRGPAADGAPEGGRGLEAGGARAGGRGPEVEQGSTAGGAPADDLGPEGEGVPAAGAGPQRGRAQAGRGRRSAPWAERLEARLEAGDTLGAWGVLEACLVAGADVESIYLDVVAPAMRAIGERWERGEIDVGVEHRASGICTRLLGRLAGRFARRGRSRGTVVVGTPPGERHALPGTLLADVLRTAGWEVSDLGADLPAEDFAAAARAADRLVAVGVSVTSPECSEAAAHTIAVVRAALEVRVPILVGGLAVPDAGAAAALGADGFAPDARGVVAWLQSH